VRVGEQALEIRDDEVAAAEGGSERIGPVRVGGIDVQQRIGVAAAKAICSVSRVCSMAAASGSLAMAVSSS
jgi:hypothetical protein